MKLIDLAEARAGRRRAEILDGVLAELERLATLLDSNAARQSAVLGGRWLAQLEREAREAKRATLATLHPALRAILPRLSRKRTRRREIGRAK